MSTAMSVCFVEPIELAGFGVTLRPLELHHEAALIRAASDGALWQLRFTSVPEPEHTKAYIERALAQRTVGERFAFAVFDQRLELVGCTSYHDIVPNIRRVEIGWTWYAKSAQRTNVNTACKMLLMAHAFESLQCEVVGWRTDIINEKSQRAIERLGAKRDGVIRKHGLRRDGSIRDTVFYSVIADEWRQEIRARMEKLLARRG